MKIILTTTRLVLRTWKPNDIVKMAAISADPIVMEHFLSTQDLEATKKLVEHINHHYEKYGYALYAVEVKGTNGFIGFVGLNVPSFEIPNFSPKSLPVVEIGWRLASTHWGKGFATEAASAVLHYAFTQLNLDEVVSFTSVNNLKSRRIMEKIGLKHDSKDDFDHPKLDKTSPLCRHVLYRLTRDEYLKTIHQET